MAEKIKREKTENQSEWNYQKLSGKVDKKNIGYCYGQIFTY